MAVPVIHKDAFPDLFASQSVTAIFLASPAPARENRRWTGAPPLFPARCGHGGVAQFTFAQRPLGGGRSRPNDPCGKALRKPYELDVYGYHSGRFVGSDLARLYRVRISLALP